MNVSEEKQDSGPAVQENTGEMERLEMEHTRFQELH